MKALKRILAFEERPFPNAPEPNANRNEQLPGVGIPAEKPWLTKEALLEKPYYLGKERRAINYPTISKILAAEGDESPIVEEVPPESPVEPEGGDREAEKAANFAKLDIESPEDFATKYQGKIAELAEEHGIGDVLGYSFRTHKIELIGSEKILLLDYDMNALHTRDMLMV